MIDTIEITKMEYLNLLKDSEALRRLENGGVDNWDWYSESLYGTEFQEDFDEWYEATKKKVFNNG